MLPPLLPCCSLGYPGWQLLNQPFLFYIFFAFRPCLPRFPRGVYSYFAVSCAFSPPFRPPQSYSRSRYRRPRSHLRYSPRLCPMYVCIYIYGMYVLVANPKIRRTDPACGLLDREKKTKGENLAVRSPPFHAAVTEEQNKTFPPEGSCSGGLYAFRLFFKINHNVDISDITQKVPCSSHSAYWL